MSCAILGKGLNLGAPISFDHVFTQLHGFSKVEIHSGENLGIIITLG
jgi:hypothetical protein